MRLVFLLVLARLALHLWFGGDYGFHRDELATIDDARYLAAGYVAYPPVTPLIARAALELFGESLRGFRLFTALAQALAMLVTALLARELGASRAGQALAALAAGIAPIAMVSGVLFQYVAFDYLWWVLVAFCAVRLLRSADARWWLAIGALFGIGMMTKYTMGFLVLGVVAGVLFTPARRFLRSPWLWAGAILSVLIFLPNLVWQQQHDFISLEFLRHIHERDVRIGRTDGFMPDQFLVATNPLTAPLWIAGLWYFFASREGKPYRMLGWMYVVPLLLFLIMEGRGYYLGPAYPMLFAGGAIAWDRWLGAIRPAAARGARYATVAILLLAFGTVAPMALPVGPVHSPLWNARLALNREFAEEIGWEELTATVARVWRSLPDAERRTAGIFAGNYGEAGAINLYRDRYGLPEAISGVNSYWYRGPGDPPPTTLIMLGVEMDDARKAFSDCRVAARVTNRWNVDNNETRDHPHVLLCRGPKATWDTMWPETRSFG